MIIVQHPTLLWGIILLYITVMPLCAYELFREQWYRLYAQEMYSSQADIAENIEYLEQALQAEYANPQFALAYIANETQWKKYKALFTMHLNLRLVHLYLMAADNFLKHRVHFYDRFFSNITIESMNRGIQLLEFTKLYWTAAQTAAYDAQQYSFIRITDQEFWEDELYRIVNNTLDYNRIINKHIQLAKKNIAFLEKKS